MVRSAPIERRAGIMAQEDRDNAKALRDTARMFGVNSEEFWALAARIEAGKKASPKEIHHDDLDLYLTEQMQNPGFREAYERAEWIDEKWWRRFLNRWAPFLLRGRK
jgi:hypothetical protein